jgi:hypothetical protein
MVLISEGCANIGKLKMNNPEVKDAILRLPKGL